MSTLKTKYLQALRALHHASISGDDVTDYERYVQEVEKEIEQDRAATLTLLRERVEGLRGKFIPADNKWFGDDDYTKGEHRLVPAKDPDTALYCLTCEGFLYEEGCSCETITIDQALQVIDEVLNKE